MKTIWLASATTLLLISCSQDSSRVPHASAPVTVASGPEASPHKALLPLYEATSSCLKNCKTIWYSVSKDSTPLRFDFIPKLPEEFSELVEDPAEMDRFIALVDQLPPDRQSVGKLGPDDEEREVRSKFGSYVHKQPRLYGSLDNVIDRNNHPVYIYSNVRYFRNESLGNMNIAIDPTTREYAAVLRSGSNLDGYHIIGAKSLLEIILAYSISSDLETAEMLAHYERKAPGSYVSRPIILPLTNSLNEGLVRTQILNDLLGTSNAATGIPHPSVLLQAEAARAKNAWYGVSQGRDKCIESSMTPADRIELLRSAGVEPLIFERKSSTGELTAVEVEAVDGGSQLKWIFFKSKEACEQAIVSTPIPDNYR